MATGNRCLMDQYLLPLLIWRIMENLELVPTTITPSQAALKLLMELRILIRERLTNGMNTARTIRALDQELSKDPSLSKGQRTAFILETCHIAASQLSYYRTGATFLDRIADTDLPVPTTIKSILPMAKHDLIKDLDQKTVLLEVYAEAIKLSEADPKAKNGLSAKHTKQAVLALFPAEPVVPKDTACEGCADLTSDLKLLTDNLKSRDDEISQLKEELERLKSLVKEAVKVEPMVAVPADVEPVAENAEPKKRSRSKAYPEGRVFGGVIVVSGADSIGGRGYHTVKCWKCGKVAGMATIKLKGNPKSCGKCNQ